MIIYIIKVISMMSVKSKYNTVILVYLYTPIIFQIARKFMDIPILISPKIIRNFIRIYNF